MVHASLFSGIGGPEVAAAMLGWDNAFHCEINPFGRKVLEYWFPNSKSYEDITKTNFSEWRGKIDVLTGGFPCQPFSNAGKRRGEEDDRYLWPQMLRVIKEIRPSWIIGENVAGITSMVEQCEALGMEMQISMPGENCVEKFHYRFTIERVCGDLEAAVYSVQPVLIPACAVGAPHRRNRVFFIAHVEDTYHMGLQRNEELGHHSRHGNAWTTSDDGEVKQTSTDANGLRFKRKINQAEKRNGDDDDGQNLGFNGEQICGERWKTFPTVSPVCRGNDGLPFDVDNLTIPFSKWRNESIKAYGNAIVPQVMYEILRAIDIVSR